MDKWLPFEKPLVELENQVNRLKALTESGEVDFTDEINRLEKKIFKVQSSIYSKLSRWQRVELARHPLRPYALDYIERITTDFIELHGDRRYSDDKAIVGGLAKIDHYPVIIIGQQKGRNTKEKLIRNFGMPHPDGYRKALRLFRMADKFGLPIINLIDTPGAYPGIGAEERGQFEAIAYNLKEMFSIRVPMIIVIIGEGASGGALGIGIGDRVFMFENSWYSVISPEGCSAILWKTRDKKMEAAEVLKLTAEDLSHLQVIDDVIKEPIGGAHRNYDEAAAILKKTLIDQIEQLSALDPTDLLAQRHQKFAAMGYFIDKS